MSPLAPPWEDAVEQAVADRLAAIEAGEMYYRTPSLVTRTLIPDVREYDVPGAEPGGLGTEVQRGVVLGVVRGSGSTLEPDDQERLGPALRFAVVIYAKGEVGGASDRVTSRILREAKADVIKRLYSDPTLGGLVDELATDGGDSTDEGAIEPYGWLIQPFIASDPGGMSREQEE